MIVCISAPAQKGCWRVLDGTIWIAWERHRRTESIAAMLGVRVFMLHSRAPRWRRVPEFIRRTIGILARERPKVLMVQNPSIILTAFALALRPLLRYRLVVDAHNAGVYRFEKEQKYTAWLLPVLHRFADLTIVTNEHVARVVENNGGKTFVLLDPLPQFTDVADSARAPADSGPFIVTFICSYAADEPYREVYSATGLMPQDMVLRAEARCQLVLRHKEFKEKNQSAVASLIDGIEDILTLRRLGVSGVPG